MDAYDDAARERWVREDPARKRADRDDFARDRGRLVHSAALRRLAAKTQVMEPDSDDFVRNRLTHSLEVAQIGRELGAALGCSADVVDSACLAHDLGHPPFGHNGEAALDDVARAAGGFEGNAQTFRLLTRLEAKRFHADGRSAGLNLTRATLDAASKYPWVAGESPYPTKKYGVYAADREAFDWVRREPGQGMSGVSGVCLEAQVMDWADDVAYSVHDVEDAVASGHLDLRALRSEQDMAPVYDVARSWYVPGMSLDTLQAATARLLAAQLIPETYDGSRRALAGLKDMTSRLIGRLVLTAEVATRTRYGPGPLVRHNADLVVPADARAECAVLKSLAAHFVMLSPERVVVREGERTVIQALSDAYTAEPERRLDPVYRADFGLARDDAERLRVIVDQVASLSDVRALVLHRQWG